MVQASIYKFGWILLLGIEYCIAQNIPTSSNNANVASVNNKAVDIFCDLQDESAEIFSELSGSYERVLSVNKNNFSGDTSYPVTNGVGQRITQKYEGVTDAYNSGIPVDDPRAKGLRDIISKVDSSLLKKNINAIYGVRHRISDSVHLEACRRIICQQFEQYGLKLDIQRFPYEHTTGCNIIGRLPGVGSENGRVLITAHYDSWVDSPGADDNGSGVAGLLEIARILSVLKLKYTVEFIAFDLEEEGSKGSDFYLSEESPDQQDDIIGVINVDMIGYCSEAPNTQIFPEELKTGFPDLYKQINATGNKGNFLLNITNEDSRSLAELFNKSTALYVPALKVRMMETPGEGPLSIYFENSDHAQFWYHKLPAVFIGEGGVTRNKYIHSPEDKLHRLNFSFMTMAVQAVAATVLQLAEVQGLP